MSELKRFVATSKLAFHQHWLKDYALTKFNYPITLEIDPTNICPLNCPNCIWSSFRKNNRNSLFTSTLARIVEEAAQLGVKSIIWTGGGEPLSNPNTVSSIKKASKLGIKNGLFTTGVPFTSQISYQLVNDLSWVRFNVGGATSKTYSSIHGVPDHIFGQVLENIKDFVRYNQENGSKISAGIGAAATSKNFPEINKLIELAKDLGLSYFQYKHDLTQMKNQSYLDWWDHSVVPTLIDLSKKFEGDNFKIQFLQNINYYEPTNSHTCHTHFLDTAITASGEVVFCKSLRDNPKMFLGNVNTSSLKNIFDSVKSKKLCQSVTPQNCGVFPCPYKELNQCIDKIINTNDFSSLTSKEKVEHPEFF